MASCPSTCQRRPFLLSSWLIPASFSRLSQLLPPLQLTWPYLPAPCEHRSSHGLGRELWGSSHRSAWWCTSCNAWWEPVCSSHFCTGRQAHRSNLRISHDDRVHDRGIRSDCLQVRSITVTHHHLPAGKTSFGRAQIWYQTYYLSEPSHCPRCALLLARLKLLSIANLLHPHQRPLIKALLWDEDRERSRNHCDFLFW